jgi:hypothetical protein
MILWLINKKNADYVEVRASTVEVLSLAGWVGCRNDQKKQGKRGYQIRGTALYCHDEENAIVLFFSFARR